MGIQAAGHIPCIAWRPRHLLLSATAPLPSAAAEPPQLPGACSPSTAAAHLRRATFLCGGLSRVPRCVHPPEAGTGGSLSHAAAGNRTAWLSEAGGRRAGPSAGCRPPHHRHAPPLHRRQPVCQVVRIALARLLRQCGGRLRVGARAGGGSGVGRRLGRAWGPDLASPRHGGAINMRHSFRCGRGWAPGCP